MITIMGLSFLGYWIPQAFAASPTITFITTSTCGSPCGTSATIFSALSNPNPSSISGQGLIMSLFCNPGGTFNYGYGTQPSILVNSVSDNVGDIWFQALEQTTISTNGAYVNVIWFTNVIVTAATTLTVTVNFVPYGTQCYSELYEASTPLTVKTIAGNQGTFNVGTGAFQVGTISPVNFAMTTNAISNPSGTLTFTTTWISTSSGGSEVVSVTNYNSHVLLETNTAGTSPPVTAVTYYLFNSVTSNIMGNVNWALTHSKSGYAYPVGISVVVFLTTTSGSTTGGGGSSNCTGVSCGVSGGGTTLDTTTSFTLTANTTYYYFATTNKGGITITNVTSKTQSYSNGGAGKGTDTIMLAVYAMQGLTNLQNFSTVTYPFTRIFNINLTTVNGETNKWLHGGTLNIGVPSNTSYIVTIISKYAGLSIYHSTTATVSMLSTTEGTFSGATWSPPYQISIQTPYANNLYLTWTGTINPISIVQVISSTVVSTCAAGATCLSATTTIWQTVTSSINNLQGGSGGTAITENLIYYWPVWLLPMLFIPFGMQGILIGFIFGDVIGAISGIIPLWAAFLLGLGTIYLLQRSRF